MLTLADDLQQAIPLIAVGGGITIAIVSIIFGTIRKTISAKAREESRREIAAYVAEGSITPEDAQRLLEAGGRPGGCGRRA